MNKFSLNSVKKGYVFDQDKTKNPQDTVKEVLDKLKLLFPEKNFNFENISENGFEVYDFLDENLVQRGKGATKEQSKASAIMEFVERFSWKNYDFNNNNSYQLISYNDLDKINEKDKKNFDSFLKYFLRGREIEINELLPYLNKISYDFLKGISLITNEKRLYPLSLNNICQTSNGMATGNCKEEAILQGLCEIIERHNLGFFIQNIKDIDLNLIDINSINDKLIIGLIEKLKNLGIEIYIVDLTIDLKVPTFMICGVDSNLEKEEFGYIGYGYGTQANPTKAVLRALTEYVQMRELNLKYDSKNDYLKKRQVINGNFQFALKDEIFEKIISSCNNKNLVEISEVKDLSDDDFLVELNNILNLFRKRNFDVIVVDKTMSNIDIPVFRVWSPDLIIGTYFDSSFDNLYSQTLCLIAYSKNIELRDEFFEKYFDNVLLNENSPDLELFFENFPYITKNMLKKYMNSETYPVDRITGKNYLDYINYDKM